MSESQILMDIGGNPDDRTVEIIEKAVLMMLEADGRPETTDRTSWEAAQSEPLVEWWAR